MKSVKKILSLANHFYHFQIAFYALLTNQNEISNYGLLFTFIFPDLTVNGCLITLTFARFVDQLSQFHFVFIFDRQLQIHLGSLAVDLLQCPPEVVQQEMVEVQCFVFVIRRASDDSQL